MFADSVRSLARFASRSAKQRGNNHGIVVMVCSFNCFKISKFYVILLNNFALIFKAELIEWSLKSYPYVVTFSN